jgi:hypothetical protein
MRLKLLAFIIAVIVSPLFFALTVNGQPRPLVSDYPDAFKSNTLVVVGDGFPHGPKGFQSSTIDGLCGSWVAVKLAQYYEAPGIVFDTDVTSWHNKTVDLLDDSHNLIAVGCHWVNIVSYHYFYMKRALVPVYPGNYQGDDPLVWPEFLVKKDSGERFAYWSNVKYKTNDYGVIVAVRDGNRNVLVLWSYTEYATIAMARVLENINSASEYGWRLNSEAVLVTWNDAHDDDKVQLNEITARPVVERSQTATYFYTRVVPTSYVTRNQTVMSTRTVTTTVKAYEGPFKCLIASAALGSELSSEVQILRVFRDDLILDSFAGRQFMRVFNSWYYSFSPQIANHLAEHPIECSVTRVALYPLIQILRLSQRMYGLVESGNELGAVTSGLLASGLIGLSYLTPPLALLVCALTGRSQARRACLPRRLLSKNS